MHLPNGDHSVRFGSVSNHTIEKEKSALDGTSQENGIHISSSNQPNSTRSTENEVSIPLLPSQGLDDVLSSILTAWAVLIQRYQRDVFHQFTWGQKNAGENGSQCIQTTELELEKHTTMLSLNTKINSLKSSGVNVNPNTSMFLNDGTPTEVCFFSKFSVKI